LASSTTPRPIKDSLVPGMVDRYLVTQMAPGMAASFGVVLVALLLYRILELFNMLADSNARFGLLMTMIGNLVPHYLGLAIPAAYFISMFLVVARLGDTSEIDALLASGLSILRLTRPFILVGVVVAIVSVFLLGWLQPFGRYGFNADIHAAEHSQWDARLQPRTFVAPGGGVTLTADAVDPAGRGLRGVFLRRVTPDGLEEVFTAQRGRLIPNKAGTELRLVLENGQQFQERAHADSLVGAFSELQVDQSFSMTDPPFRARGTVARELTLFELPKLMEHGATSIARAQASSELYTRIVRSISVPLLPLLAIPLGMAAKRGRRGPGIILSAIVLFVYEHAIDMGQSLADLGSVSAAAAVWTPCLVFAALCFWLFSHSLNRPGETPFNAAVDQIDRVIQAVRKRIIRKPAAAAAA
jgi:lipopolysaccharide export system permease protein